MSLEELRSLLSSEISTGIHNDGKTILASVLVLIYGHEPKILMTKKSGNLKSHAGEISFPGGKWDKRDNDLLETAIRETREEINLEISRDQITGQLRPVTTLNSGFTITPFVAIIDSMSSLKENSEVEKILHIPLKPFLKTLAEDPDPSHNFIQEMYTFTFQEHLVWGASARMLKQIVDIFSKKNLI